MFRQLRNVVHAFIAWWKPKWTFGKIQEKISKNPRLSLEFSPARDFSQTLPRFLQGYEGTENMFYFFMKLFFSVLTKRKAIYVAYIFYFTDFFHETVNSQNLETTIIFVLHGAMKTHLKTNQKAHTVLSKLLCKNVWYLVVYTVLLLSFHCQF